MTSEEVEIWKKSSPWYIVFVCVLLNVSLWGTSSHGDVSIDGKLLQHLSQCLAVTESDLGGIFFVIHLLWHKVSAFAVQFSPLVRQVNFINTSDKLYVFSRHIYLYPCFGLRWPNLIKILIAHKAYNADRSDNNKFVFVTFHIILKACHYVFKVSSNKNNWAINNWRVFIKASNVPI